MILINCMEKELRDGGRMRVARAKSTGELSMHKVLGGRRGGAVRLGEESGIGGSVHDGGEVVDFWAEKWTGGGGGR